ncbi:MAG: 3'-5' exonuclease [Gemmatimonadota bacterium]
MTGAGVRFSDSSSLLSRAMDLMEEGPQSTARIAGRVFGVRSGPPGLAARMVFELLAEDHRVRVDADGVWRLAADAGREDRPLDSLSYVVVDVETTGMPVSQGGRIIEIAAVQVREGALRDEFATLINPGGPIPRWVSGLTGISQEMVASAPRFEEVCDELRRRLEGRVFVAHNAAYDWAYVSAEMRRARRIVPSGPRLCTVRMARKALPGVRRRGLDSLAAFYGIEIEGRHRAEGDARATALLLLRLLQEADRQGVGRWGELQSWLGRRGSRGRRGPKRRHGRGGKVAP